MATKKIAKVKSIQSTGRKRGHKSHVAQLNDKTLKTAHRHGLKWDDEDVELLVGMIEDDSTTFDMAIRLGRTFYSAQVARSHVGFIMRHQAAFDRALACGHRTYGDNVPAAREEHNRHVDRCMRERGLKPNGSKPFNSGSTQGSGSGQRNYNSRI